MTEKNTSVSWMEMEAQVKHIFKWVILLVKSRHETEADKMQLENGLYLFSSTS